MVKQKVRPAKCSHCGHIQDYRGKLAQYTCSSCGRKVKLKGGKDGKEK